MTSQNIDLSSRNTLYLRDKDQQEVHFFPNLFQ
jgi:hypothetical protein